MYLVKLQVSGHSPRWLKEFNINPETVQQQWSENKREAVQFSQYGYAKGIKTILNLKLEETGQEITIHTEL